MANPAPVTYEIRLKDLMTKTLKKMGLSVTQLQNKLRKGLAMGLKAARVALKAFAMAAAAAGAAAAAVGLAAVRAGQSFVEAASRAEETRSKFTAVFKEQTDAANEMAQAMADQLGRNATEVQGFMARLQDTFVPMGIARDQAMEMSGAITSLAYDLTSFNPELGSSEEAIEALTSAMIGNHETVKRFGVIINEASLEQKLFEMGARKVNGTFSEQDKAMARLQIILESTTDAQGDLIKTQDSWFNSTAALQSQIEGVREEIGARLIHQLQETIANMGGVDAIVEQVRVTFEFLANILTQMIIPTVGNIMENFTKFVTAMGGVDATVMAVSETVALLGKVFGVMWNTVKVVFHLFLQGIDTIVFAVVALVDILKILAGLMGLGLVTALRLVIEGLGLLYGGLDKVVIFVKDSAIAAFQMLLNSLADIVEGVGDFLKWANTFAVVPAAIGRAGEAAADAAANLRDFSASTDELKGGESLYADISRGLDAFGDKLEPAQRVLKDFIDKSYDDLTRHSADFANAIMEDVPTIETLFAEIREGAKGVGTDYEALASKVNQALVEIGDIEITTPEQRDKIADLQAQLERLRAPLEAAAAAEDQVANSASGLSSTFDTLGGAMQNFVETKIPSMEESMTQMAEGAMSSFANGMTDALMSIIDGSKSAGEAFKAFAAQFLMDVARMIIQTLVFKAIKSAFGVPFADGGIIPGGTGSMTALANGGVVGGGLGRFVPVKGYATGGPIVNKPHVALIGEGQHNEAVVPLPDGRSIPVDMTGAPETQVSINIEAVDGASVDRMLFDRRDTLRSIISTAIAESRSFRGAVARA